MSHRSHKNMASLAHVLGMFLLALATSTLTSACPESCYCMDTFVTCSDFKYLDLTMLPPGTDTLVLTKGEVEEIPPGFLATATSLRMLEIISVHVRVVRGSAFRGLRKMDMFSITSCTFDIVEPDGFSGLSQFGKFHISDSNFGRVGKHAFGYINSVLDLRIWSSSFETIADEAFYKLSDVTSLQFYRNNITYMGRDVFSGAFKLEEASINLNRIQTILEGSFEKIGNAATSMVVQGNKFTCSCDLAWILEKPVLEEFLPLNECSFSGFTEPGVGVFRLNDTKKDMLCSTSHPTRFVTSTQVNNGREVAAVDEDFGFFEEIFDPVDIELESFTEDLVAVTAASDVSAVTNDEETSSHIPLISSSVSSPSSSSTSSSTSSAPSSSSSTELDTSSSSSSSLSPVPSLSELGTTSTAPSSNISLLSFLYSSLSSSSVSSASPASSSSPLTSSSLLQSSVSSSSLPSSSSSSTSSPSTSSSPSSSPPQSPTLPSASPHTIVPLSEELSFIISSEEPPSSSASSAHTPTSPTFPPFTASSPTPPPPRKEPEEPIHQSDNPNLTSQTSPSSPPTSIPDITTPSAQVTDSHPISMIDIITERNSLTNTSIHEDINDSLMFKAKAHQSPDTSDLGPNKDKVNESPLPAELISSFTEKPAIAVAYSTEAFDVGNLFLESSSQIVTGSSFLAVSLSGLCILLKSFLFV